MASVELGTCGPLRALSLLASIAQRSVPGVRRRRSGLDWPLQQRRQQGQPEEGIEHPSARVTNGTARTSQATVAMRQQLDSERCLVCCKFFFFKDTAATEIYTLSLHDALPI